MAENPQSIASMHLYTDSSPVTGLDVLGALMDMFIAGVRQLIILPGTTLAHGTGKGVERTLGRGLANIVAIASPM